VGIGSAADGIQRRGFRPAADRLSSIRLEGRDARTLFYDDLGLLGRRAWENDMRNVVRIAGAVLIAMAAGPALGQSLLKYIPGLAGTDSPEVWKVCEGQDGAPLDKRIEACTVLIDNATETDTVMAGAYVNRGSALTDSGDLDHATQDFNKAIALDGKQAAAFAGRAEVFVARGQLDFAILDFGQAIKLNPKNVDTYYFNRGTTYSMAGQYDKAIADFDQVIRVNPKSSAAYNNRCFARAKAGQAQAALPDCEQALQLRPYDADYLDTRGFVNLKLGQLDRAMSDYSDALDINPKLPSSLYGRGMARLKKGDKRGSADIAAAKAINADIVAQFARYGVK
jgi:tetratricopeptide (TPR) repeat protein